MRFLKSLLFVCLMGFLLSGCLSREEIIYWIEHGIAYDDPEVCVDRNHNQAIVSFRCPIESMLYNRRIQEQKMLFFSGDYTKLSDLKSDIVSALKKKKVDIAFVFYRPGERDMPVETVSLNYNELTGHFLKQNGMEAVEDPWRFEIRHNLSTDDIEKGLELRGALRFDGPEDLGGTIFSQEMVIRSLPYKKDFIARPAKCGYDPVIPPPAPPIVVPPHEEKLPPIKPPKLEILRLGETLGPGFKISGVPEKINFPQGSGWIYLLKETDVSLEKVFNFAECEFTIADIYDQKKKFYQDVWSPFIFGLFDNISQRAKTIEYKGNHFAIFLQGSADGGSSCPHKVPSRLNEIEALIYNTPIPYLFKEELQSIVRENNSWRVSNPLINNDLPYVRAGFIKSAMENSILTQSAEIAAVNGQIVKGYNPDERKVSVYLVQTDFDLAKSYPQVFKRLVP